MKLLRYHRNVQFEARFKAAEHWEESGLVFTDDLGHHLAIHTVYKDFKKVVASICIPDARVHDLRHPNVKPKTQKYLSIIADNIRSCAASASPVS